MTKTTMQTANEDVLKDEILGGVSFNEGKSNSEDVEQPVKVFKKIGGLINLGRTYFWKGDEIASKLEYVQAQMVQKYGAEIYGKSAQMTGQKNDYTSTSPT